MLMKLLFIDSLVLLICKMLSYAHCVASFLFIVTFTATEIGALVHYDRADK